MQGNESNRPPRNFVRCLEQLEDRCVPVAWPVELGAGQVPQLIGTYGQYQDHPVNLIDTNIHLHEGLDIRGGFECALCIRLN